MPKCYAIQVKEENLDLLEVLNGGVRPTMESDGRPSIFLFTADDTTPNDIVHEDSLYDENGVGIKPELVWL